MYGKADRSLSHMLLLLLFESASVIGTVMLVSTGPSLSPISFALWGFKEDVVES